MFCCMMIANVVKHHNNFLIRVAEQDFLQVFYKHKGVASVGKSYGHLPASIIVTSKYRLSFSLSLFAGYCGDSAFNTSAILLFLAAVNRSFLPRPTLSLSPSIPCASKQSVRFLS